MRQEASSQRMSMARRFSPGARPGTQAGPKDGRKVARRRRSGDAMAPPAGHRAPVRILLGVTDEFCTILLRGQIPPLRAAGAEVMFVAGPGEWSRALALEEEVEYFPLPMEREMAPLADLRAVGHMIRLLRRVRPEVVNAGTPKAALLVLAAAAVVRTPVRILTLYGLRSVTLRGAKGALVRAAERLTASLATDVICVSPSLRDEATAARIPGAATAYIAGAGNCSGVDLEHFRSSPERLDEGRRFRQRLGYRDDDLVIGFVGRLTRDKGIVELQQAWAALDNDKARLVVIGPDESGPECEAAIRLLREDPRVRITGTVTDMRAAYAAMDLLVLPTWREGMGMVLLEAAAMSLPVVACRVTGCVDAVIDGTTGTLVPPRDAMALADAIRTYLSDPVTRAAHGRAGQHRVQREFGSRGVAERQIRLYDEILRRHGRLPLHHRSPASDESAPTRAVSGTAQKA
jgi:glycosyltransferase involved in cell wall biosynthesis